jgi:hypothetical protein
VKSKVTKKGNLRVLFMPKEAELLEDLFGVFTYDTILKIFKDNPETADAMKGYEEPYDAVIDDLYGVLSTYIDERR